MLNVLRRRCKSLPVLVYPVAVQGKEAPERISRALALADCRRDCDVLILARGGGSLEDLQAFNEENVARAIHACRLPVVTGIGHETDFTVADFVADVRAPTPSAAAELASPDSAEWVQQLARAEQRLSLALGTRLRQLGQRLDWLERRLTPQNPRRRIGDQRSRLAGLERSLRRSLQLNLQARSSTHQRLNERLLAASPRALIERREAHGAALRQRAEAAILRCLQTTRERLAVVARGLDTISPLATLQRGYAIVCRERDGLIVTDARQTQPGEALEARLARGRLGCRVETIIDAE
jgi:exodeoxyribonuclease VII large subunit